MVAAFIVILPGQVSAGPVPSILVVYVVVAELEHASVTITVIVAEQVPDVLAVLVSVPGQPSVAVVAANAAASASACEV